MRIAQLSSIWSRPVDLLNSIGARLIIAFGVVSATTVLAGTVAFVSFTQLGDTVDTFASATLPAMEASLNVVSSSSDISAAAPALLAARTQAEAVSVSNQIGAEQSRLVDAMTHLSGHGEEIADLTRYAARMRQQLDALAMKVDRRFSVNAALEREVDRVTEAQRMVTQNLAPLLDDSVFNLTMQLSPGDGGSAAELESRLLLSRDLGLITLQDLYDLHADTNRLSGLLTAAAMAPAAEMLTPLHDSAMAASQQIERASADLPSSVPAARLRESLAMLQTRMAGDRNLFDLRREELGVVAEAETVLASSRLLAAQLHAVARQVAANEQTAARDAAARSHVEIAWARLVLAGIASFSFIVSLVIAWLYVGQRVVRRLTGLASVMHDLAEGDTDIAVPGRHRRDEIGAMAAALDVFRRHVIENRQLMIEREQQRQQAEEGRHAALIAMQAAQETARLRQLSDSTFEGLLIHRDGMVLDANTAFCDMIGLGLGEVRGQKLARFTTTWTDVLDSPTQKEGARMREITITTASDETLPVEVRSRDIVYGGDPARVTALRDISERRAAEGQIRFLAHHDVLTGLANRFQLNDIATREIAASRRSGNPFAVLCVDLDRFKSVNDTFGHHAGDLVLRQVAERIGETVRETDVAARVGGDEFVVLQTAMVHASDASQLTRRLVDRLSESYDIDGQPVSIGASIGIAVYPQDGDQVDILLSHADLALYRVKSQGRGDFCFFEAEMDASHRERREMEQDLAHAIQAGQMELAYQPIFDAAQGDVIAFEALVRWAHPVHGIIMPDKFIRLAEETNLIIPLGKWVLETACRAALTWQSNCRVAVNVSVRQFSCGDLPALVAEVLERTGLPATRLELEVTESLLITNTENALQALAALKQLGIRIVLDDFGTGYSSLSYLQRFAFDKIKVDRSFIQGLTDDSSAQAIVSAILAMSHQLNIEVTAEGVESGSQLALLRSERCDEIQGFLLGRPIAADLVADYLAGIRAQVETGGPDKHRSAHIHALAERFRLADA